MLELLVHRLLEVSFPRISSEPWLPPLDGKRGPRPIALPTSGPNEIVNLARLILDAIYANIVEFLTELPEFSSVFFFV